MRILHTSDWHLGKRLDRFSRHEEQVQVLEEIVDIAQRESVDAVLISGDIYDTYNPPTESTELLYHTLKSLADNGRRAVVALSGNHDSPDRIEAPDPLARECGIVFLGYPLTTVRPFRLSEGIEITRSRPGAVEIRTPSVGHPLRIIGTPYANEYRLRACFCGENPEEELRSVLARHWANLAAEFCDAEGVNLLAAHLFFVGRGETPLEEPTEEKPILHVGGAQAIYTDAIPSQVQYTALGHLHRRRVYHKEQAPVVYSGSPLGYGFAESGDAKSVTIVDVHPGEPARAIQIPLTKGKPLIRGRHTTVEAALSWLSDNSHAYVELTMATDQYLASEDRARINEVHDRIVAIIPETGPGTYEFANRGNSIDLSKGMSELFKDYFCRRMGQAPGGDILSLFQEVVAGDNS